MTLRDRQLGARWEAILFVSAMLIVGHVSRILGVGKNDPLDLSFFVPLIGLASYLNCMKNVILSREFCGNHQFRYVVEEWFGSRHWSFGLK